MVQLPFGFWWATVREPRPLGWRRVVAPPPFLRCLMPCPDESAGWTSGHSRPTGTAPIREPEAGPADRSLPVPSA